VSLRWGFLSTARINRLVLAGARETDRAEVIAVASRDAARAQAYARDHQIERAYGSYDALLEDADVEAVYIPLPNSMHFEWTLRALEAGKHVLCEKPFSRHLEEVGRAFDLADSAGLVLSEGFMWRHNPQTARISGLLAEGAVGRVRVVRVAMSFQLVAVHGANDVRLQPELDGGALMDVGCYCVSAIRLVAGEPERAQGEQVVGESGVDVVFAGTLACADGVLGHFDCGFVLPRRGELEVIGEAGVLYVPDPFHVAAPGIELRRRDGVERIAVESANSYQLELENIADAARGDAPLLLGRDDAVGQARTIEALYRSAA
jgi:D-xylose 1-dehydrogenase (NADP+, D-xylono-1,5-lactone-forming)